VRTESNTQGRFFVGTTQGNDYILGSQTCSSINRDINGATFTSPITGFAWFSLASIGREDGWVRFYGVEIEVDANGVDPTLNLGVEQNLTKDEFLNFRILGQNSGENSSAMMIENDASNNYIFQLPPDNDLPFNLQNQYVKLYKKYSDGLAGGITFSIVDNIGDKYVRRQINGKPNTFFQNNAGYIVNLLTGEIDQNYNKFIDEMFISNNSKTVLNAGQTAYVDVCYDNFFAVNETQENPGDLNFIQTNFGKQSIQFDQRLNFEIKNSDWYNDFSVDIFNGDFSQGMYGWDDNSVHGETVDSSNFSNNQLTLSRSSGSPNDPSQAVIQKISGFNSGRYYKLKLNIASCTLNGIEDGQGLVFIVETPGADDVNLMARQFGAGVHEFIFRSQAKNLYLVLEGGHQGGVTTVFNSVSIEEHKVFDRYQSNMEISVLDEVSSFKKK
jgi:hypothetical protein